MWDAFGYAGSPVTARPGQTAIVQVGFRVSKYPSSHPNPIMARLVPCYSNSSGHSNLQTPTFQGQTSMVIKSQSFGQHRITASYHLTGLDGIYQLFNLSDEVRK